MTEEDPPTRQFVGLRLRPASIARIDEIAIRFGKSRSEVIRRAMLNGMDATERHLESERRSAQILADAARVNRAALDRLED